MMEEPGALEIDTMMYAIGAFRSVERKNLESAIATVEGEAVFFAALTQFLETWAKSGWVEGYKVARIGHWIAMNAKEPLRKKAQELANEHLDSNDQNRRKTYGDFVQALSETSRPGGDFTEADLKKLARNKLANA